MTPQVPGITRIPTTTISPGVARALTIYELRDPDTPEVLRFLAERPLHTVTMSGFIRDNGMESPFNRGTFYGYRDGHGQLEGVALIGHATFLESRCDTALAEFARVAQGVRSAHMIMGEQDIVERFWNFYSPHGQERRMFSHEVLFAQTSPANNFVPVPALRTAGLDDLSLIIPVHAAMACDESGINPLEVDAEGFSRRCARRVRQGRVWIWLEAGRLIFKADVVSDTPEAVYLEGIYVAPAERNRGYGSRCLSQLARNLLQHTSAVVLLANEENRPAHSFFENVGFIRHGLYETIFLAKNRNH
jgi:predicted GNAT family acetyltransferase